MRQRKSPRQRPLVLVAPIDSRRKPPDPPDGLSEKHVADWAELWRSPLAEGLSPIHLEGLRRLFSMRQDYDDLRRVAFADPVVRGSTGQPAANPLFAVADRLAGRILETEREFALTLKSQLAAGMTLAHSAEVIARAKEKSADRDRRSAEEDPRAITPKTAHKRR